MAEPGRITELLVAYRDGDADAFDALVALVYPELRRLAVCGGGAAVRGGLSHPASRGAGPRTLIHRLHASV